VVFGRNKELKILISHISEEALFALLLKDFIESTFLGQFEVSLSSNSGDSGVGDKWLVELDGSLTAADLLLVLCSPKSIRQPWVHFKFGCAWTKTMPITCLCHSGLNKVGLPSHLRTFDVLEVDDEDFMEQLFGALAKRFNIKRLPRLSYDTMKAELRATLVSIAHTLKHADAGISARGGAVEKDGIQPTPKPSPEHIDAEPLPLEKVESAEEEVEDSEAAPLLDKGFDEEVEERIEERIREKKEPSKPETQPRSAPAVVIKKKGKKRRKKKEAQAEPESVQKRVLKLLAGAGDTGYPLEDLADLLGIVGPRLEPYLDVLKDQAYINISVEVGRPPEYTIAAKGEQYLAESKPI
jgi:hypothetical protein